jgi:hypothetical protein
MLVPEKQIDVTLPSGSVKMLIVQPYLEFQRPVQEPFPLRPTCQRRLLDAIDNVFIACGTINPQLVLFPEFTLPGIDGVERIVAHMSSRTVASPTVVIGGVCGLPKEEYTRLCALQNIANIDLLNAPDRITTTVGQYIRYFHQGRQRWPIVVVTAEDLAVVARGERKTPVDVSRQRCPGISRIFRERCAMPVFISAVFRLGRERKRRRGSGSDSTAF